MDRLDAILLTIVVVGCISFAIAVVLIANSNNECHQKNGVMVKTEFGYQCLKVEYAK